MRFSSARVLIRNTIQGSFWQVFRLILQMIYLIVVARILGVDGYGTFSGVLALAASIAPLSGLGLNLILVKHVSRSPSSFSTYWGRAMAVTFISAVPLIGLLWLVEFLLVPFPDSEKPILVSLIATSELLFVPIVLLCSNAYQARERLGRSIFCFVILSVFRLLAAAFIFFYSASPTLTFFGWLYFGASFLSAVVNCINVMREYGVLVWAPKGIMEDLREGFWFSVGGFTSNAHAEIDKSLLLRMGGSVAAGTYSVSSRIISAACMPLFAFILATVPRLFREGERGVTSSLKFAKGLLPPVIAYGVLAGVGIFICSPLLPIFFGSDFSGAVNVTRWLAILPSLLGVSSIFLALLSCSNAQFVRVVIEGTAVVINALLNIYLIPIFGLNGTIVSILLSQSALLVMALYATSRLIHHEQRQHCVF